MAISSQNGTTLGISATLPTTFDDNVSTGYPSLTFTLVGEVVDFGELGKVYNMITHQAVALRYPKKIKGTYDIPDVTITVARDSADAGQVIVAAALASDNSYSFEVTLPSGDTANFTAKVTKAAVGAVASDQVEGTAITLSVDPETLFEA